MGAAAREYGPGAHNTDGRTSAETVFGALRFLGAGADVVEAEDVLDFVGHYADGDAAVDAARAAAGGDGGAGDRLELSYARAAGAPRVDADADDAEAGGDDALAVAPHGADELRAAELKRRRLAIEAAAAARCSARQRPLERYTLTLDVRLDRLPAPRAHAALVCLNPAGPRRRALYADAGGRARRGQRRRGRRRGAAAVGRAAAAGQVARRVLVVDAAAGTLEAFVDGAALAPIARRRRRGPRARPVAAPRGGARARARGGGGVRRVVLLSRALDAAAVADVAAAAAAENPGPRGARSSRRSRAARACAEAEQEEDDDEEEEEEEDDEEEEDEPRRARRKKKS
ncbi:hypothetical protein SO694_00027159 [Aureococcus anophagefferens]|uniref:Glycosyl hydrolase family 32 C-terminal domain-containing protein n=1 Tax=Aureococcus anophagefferens TaxID=44056 RepID=A0ABR1FUQ8_AURAN